MLLIKTLHTTAENMDILLHQVHATRYKVSFLDAETGLSLDLIYPSRFYDNFAAADAFAVKCHAEIMAVEAKAAH